MIPQSAAVCPSRMPVCAASSVPITTRARSLLMRRRSVRSLRKSRTVPAISPTSSPSSAARDRTCRSFSSHFPRISSAPLPFPLFFFFRWRGLGYSGMRTGPYRASTLTSPVTPTASMPCPNVQQHPAQSPNANSTIPSRMPKIQSKTVLIGGHSVSGGTGSPFKKRSCSPGGVSCSVPSMFSSICSFSSSAGSAGRSSMLASEKLRRNWSVVRNSMGFPGTSSRPASSMSPFSARLLTVFDESTPLSWSMNARVTGWRYAMMVSRKI